MRLKPSHTDQAYVSDAIDLHSKQSAQHEHVYQEITDLGKTLASPTLVQPVATYRRVPVVDGILELDLSSGTRFAPVSPISDSITIRFKNPPLSGAVRTFTLMLQYAVGSTATIVWGSPVDFGAYPFTPSGGGKTDILVITTKDGGASYHAGVIGHGSSSSLGAIT